MPRIGVILAAGEATRLPNKALLPTRRDGELVVESALGLLLRSACSRVLIVVRARSILPVVLKRRRRYGCSYVNQPSTPLHAGVGGAIRAAASDCDEDDQMLITFCDNIFDETECVPSGLPGPLASVRQVLTQRCRQLDGHRDGRWTPREDLRDEDPRLAGWYLLPADRVRSSSAATTGGIDLLNELGASAYVVQGHEWHDVGTEDTYEEYMR
jgi:NDP-sugar pyrophosphorylase family protein